MSKHNKEDFYDEEDFLDFQEDPYNEYDPNDEEEYIRLLAEEGDGLLMAEDDEIPPYNDSDVPQDEYFQEDELDYEE